MKTVLIALLAFLHMTMLLHSQTGSKRLYDPDADAEADLRAVIATAAEQQKHVFIQIGGNWCSWCIKFDTLISADRRIDSLLRADYVLLRINYSKENRNRPVLARLGYPQRFGFPVFVILDSSGLRVHTQDSGLLEEGNRHDPNLVLSFLKNWSPRALDPQMYSD